LFENANDAIFIMREDRFIDCNPKTLEMFGCGKEQLVGQPPYHFSPELQPDGRNSKEKALEKIELALQGEPQFFEWRHIRHDATPFEAEVSLNRLELSGEIFLQAIVREVTQRKQAEQALIKASRMDTATTLAGGIAHKVNNLMVSVLGYAELLKAKLAQQSDASNMLTVIAESAQETGELAQQMLAFARSGQYQLQTINLNVILQKVLQLRPRSVWSKIQLEQNTSPDLWDVEADSTQISQVILNLLTNAREAIENNGRIIITTENIRVDETSKQQYPDLKRGSYVCLSVQDNGEGMSAETLAKVFEPFFTTKFQGRGMGLAAVYGIVHSHGGHITATSQPEAGTTFKVYLPAIQPELTQPPQSTSKEEIPPASAVEKKQTILVVEDEAMVLEMMQRMLNQLGYHPLMAQNEREAVEIAQTFQGDIHLMLLDIGIPAMSSMEMYSILTKIRPEMQVILCSSYELDDVARSLLEAGASGFMRKPFQMKVLEAEIHKVLAG
jgi:two-component system cell cycle sensor histidine kinase/response regulator CckA